MQCSPFLPVPSALRIGAARADSLEAEAKTLRQALPLGPRRLPKTPPKAP